MSRRHSSLGEHDVHRAYTWTFENASQRLDASGFLVGDVGKDARQLDNETRWTLTHVDPPTWVQLGGGSGESQSGGGDPNIDTFNHGTITSVTCVTSTVSANQIADTLSAQNFRTIHYLIQISSNGYYQTTELYIIHDDVNVYMSETDTIMTGSNLVSFDAAIVGNDFNLLVTPTNAVTTLKIIRTAINK